MDIFSLARRRSVSISFWVNYSQGTGKLTEKNCIDFIHSFILAVVKNVLKYFVPFITWLETWKFLI